MRNFKELIRMLKNFSNKYVGYFNRVNLVILQLITGKFIAFVGKRKRLNLTTSKTVYKLLGLSSN